MNKLYHNAKQERNNTNANNQHCTRAQAHRDVGNIMLVRLLVFDVVIHQGVIQDNCYELMVVSLRLHQFTTRQTFLGPVTVTESFSLYAFVPRQHSEQCLYCVQASNRQHGCCTAPRAAVMAHRLYCSRERKRLKERVTSTSARR